MLLQKVFRPCYEAVGSHMKGRQELYAAPKPLTVGTCNGQVSLLLLAHCSILSVIQAVSAFVCLTNDIGSTCFIKTIVFFFSCCFSWPCPMSVKVHQVMVYLERSTLHKSSWMWLLLLARPCPMYIFISISAIVRGDVFKPYLYFIQWGWVSKIVECKIWCSCTW